ncbi:MAG: glycosyltransferase family 2 protein [Calothrix sp. SM1_7_51]|nr:glycosyltransferase family 2 protein [Calothrix sp. SM1_7_51]
MSKPTIICLTPIKNEAWILHRFLKCTSLWADHIIIADQQSTDESREIASSYPKVILVDNPSPTFNEPERQKILLEAARRIPGQRLLITLDADEILTSNYVNSPEWKTILQAPSGTIIRFQRVNLLPNLSSYWLEANGAGFALGFMDDGSEHVGREIHSERIPLPEQANTIELRDIKVLHYQFVNWERMESKHRWYQCWERLNHPEEQAVEIYRQYHHMYGIPQNEIITLPKSWLSGYEQQQIDMTSINREPFYWWDKEVLAWFDKYGTATFRRENIWDIDWSALSKKINNSDVSSLDYKDPRSTFEKYVHRWLRKTQGVHWKRHIQLTQKFLGLLGW